MDTVDQLENTPPAIDRPSVGMDDEILKLEFERIYSLFEQSEEFGEKRTTLMITVTGFLFGGFFALLKDDSNYFFTHAFIFWLMILANLFLLILGVMTLVRMAYRNLNTDDYKEAIKLIKKYYISRSPNLNAFLYFGAKEKLNDRRRRPFKGGYIEITKLINSVLTGILVYMLLNYLFYLKQDVVPCTNTEVAVLGTILTSALAWMAQRLITDRIYDSGYEKHEEKLEKLAQNE